MEKFTYAALMLFTISVPLACSFEHRLKYYKNWKPLFQATLPVAFLFITWDVLFTRMGVWAFEESRIIGIKIFNLPLEECLFFFMVPFSCVFIYEVLNWYFKKDFMVQSARKVTIVLAVAFGILSAFNYTKIYTFVTFALLSGFLIYLISRNDMKVLGNFYRSFFGFSYSFFHRKWAVDSIASGNLQWR
jgi:lycopene cyclase domain-containing protein